MERERFKSPYLEIVKMHFSPRDISKTPSSHPATGQLPVTVAKMKVIDCGAPRMTLPVPISVLNGPRPEEESNLIKGRLGYYQTDKLDL